MDYKDFAINVSYRLSGSKKSIAIDDSDNNVKFITSITDDRIVIKLKTTTKVKIDRAEILYDHYFENDEMFFANGYQSWTYSTEYKRGDRQLGLRSFCKLPFVKNTAGATGDYSFTEYGRDLFHSCGYTYLKIEDKCQFFGSLNERTGYTTFYADMLQNVFVIDKDLEGIEIDGEYEMLNIFVATGTYDEVFDKYFNAYPLKNTNRVKHLAGYTSWYNYYQNINEDIILRDLKGLTRAKDKAQIFQIDDGYEQMVGDWNYSREKFPNGIKPICDKIHEEGLLAGIWLAPFSAQFGSKVVEEHPDWLLHRENGNKVIGGVAWGGFYVLDIEKEPVKEYIRKCFDRVFNNWGFDMVKLDFLYSAAIIPRNNKTRGQLMAEALDFLRECVGDKIFLGCGVPLVPAFGICDACRISSDMEFEFNEKFYAKMTNAEIVSTCSAMNNSAFRRHLDGRIWANDPDVFFLRNDGMHKAKYTMAQKRLLAKVNKMFGNVLFVSDDIGAYNSEQLDILLDTYCQFDGKVIDVYRNENIINVTYQDNAGKHHFWYNNVTGDTEDKII